MSDIALYLTTIGGFLTLIVAAAGYLITRNVNTRVEKVKADADELRRQTADMKAQIQHVDLEYIKKILIRVTDNETQIKQVENNLDLTDEKLKSFMNRTSARFPRPKNKEAVTETTDDQQDIIEQLKQSGDAIPLGAQANATAPVFVRSSVLNQRRRAG